jgi:GDP-4-dehydro-6-deoxy-D-mannose reductase
MKVLVTGATGFVGQWLTRELRDAGHDLATAPGSAELDIADLPAVRALVDDSRPDVIAHLAAVASSHDASRDPGRAIRTNVGGTVAVTEAARTSRATPALLVISSAEVYAPPGEGDAPLDEDAPLAPRHPYGMLKLAQESVAVAAARRHELPMVVLRPFNHVGPGQPPTTAVASFATRIAAVRRGETEELAVGNIDVERDIGDVRDYVVAYRLIAEELVAGRLGRPPAVFNVATGSAVSLRWVIDELCRLASVTPRIVVDSDLVRPDDPPRIVGSAERLRGAIGWQPRIELAATLADVLAGQPG